MSELHPAAILSIYGALSVLFIFLLRLAEGFFHFRIGPSPSEEQAAEIDEVRRQLNEQKMESKRAQQDLQGQIHRLQRKNEEQRERINFLLDELRGSGALSVMESLSSEHQPWPIKPMLFICSEDVDGEICNSDLMQLRRARMRLDRLTPGTLDSIAQETKAARQNEEMYVWVHVAAHSIEMGVPFADGLADGAWWQAHLSGVQVLFLNGCKTTAFSYVLSGFIPFVISVIEDIENEIAADFTYAFWRRMAEGGENADPRLCYNESLMEVSQASEYVRMRQR